MSCVCVCVWGGDSNVGLDPIGLRGSRLGEITDYWLVSAGVASGWGSVAYYRWHTAEAWTSLWLLWAGLSIRRGLDQLTDPLLFIRLMLFPFYIKHNQTGRSSSQIPWRRQKCMHNVHLCTPQKYSFSPLLQWAGEECTRWLTSLSCKNMFAATKTGKRSFLPTIVSF